MEARQARDGATGWDRIFVCAATNVCLADVIVGAGGIFVARIDGEERCQG